MKVSVITPALNPRPEYIRRVFDALRNQTLPKDEWEYIVVDSGSTPPLKKQLDLSWHPNSYLIEAPEQRLAVSRLRGLEQAKGDLIIFVDDDNVLAPDYVETAISEMNTYPFIGVLGGYTEGEFHGVVQPWMHEFLPILGALQYLPEPMDEICYALMKSGGPWVPSGSGMIIRKSVAVEYRRQAEKDPDKLTIGRVGTRLLGSDDVDLAYTAIDMSMAIGRSKAPQLIHLIPESRLTELYFVRLLYASNYATAHLLVRRGWKESAHIPSVTFVRRLRAGMREVLSRFKDITPQQRCWKAFSEGYRDGLAGAPFNVFYQ